jgi:hypothetical protein
LIIDYQIQTREEEEEEDEVGFESGEAKGSR